MPKRETWVFVFAALGGLGGLACILQWGGITPRDLATTRLVTLPHILWLFVGLGLFAASIWSTLRAGVVQKQAIKQLQKKLSKRDEDVKESARRNLEYRAQIETLGARHQELEAAHKDELRRLEIQHKNELYNSQEAYRQCIDEQRAAKTKMEPLNELQIDALGLSARLLTFINEQGPEPTPKYSRQQIENMPGSESKRLINANDKDYDFACEFWFGGPDGIDDGVRTAPQLERLMMARYRMLDPWYEKISGAFELSFRHEVEHIRNRFRIAGLSDDNILLTPIQGKMGRENIKAIAEKLWQLAYRLREKEVVIESQ